MWFLKGLNFLLLFTSFLFVQSSVDCDELKSLFVATRHGMRKFLIHEMQFALLVSRCYDHFDPISFIWIRSSFLSGAPFFLFENDPLNKTMNETFPNGFGEITEKGKQQMRDVAAFLQTNYSQFFAGKLCDGIEIKSGDQGRLIESAKLLLNELRSNCECNKAESIYVTPVSFFFEHLQDFSNSFKLFLSKSSP